MVFVRWEASEAGPRRRASAGRASCSASLCVLYAARRSPSVANLFYKQSISIANLSAHRSLQALQGTKKQNTTAKSTPANAAAVHPAVRPRAAKTHPSE